MNPTRCHFGHDCPSERLTLVHYPDGCWVYPHDYYQWLCPQHTIKGLQNNVGDTMRGFLHKSNEQALAEAEEKYQQLMEKAVRFAMALTCDEDLDIRACTTARDFLTSPEVQTWRMQQLEVKE